MSKTPPPSVVAVPATPQNVMDTGSFSEINSTPSNHGSTSSTERPANFQVADVNPIIFQDVRNHQTCDVETLLKYLLERSYGPNPTDDLLEQCLDAVLPYCNDGYPKSNDRKDKTSQYVQTMREYLTEYCSTREETKRYSPFVGAFNYALKVLQNVTVRPRPRANSTNIWFHMNDPALIQGNHNVGRKPDPDGLVMKWDDVVFKVALKSPKRPFQWEDVLSSLEFKAVRSTFDGPPREYKSMKPAPISAEPTPETWDITEYQVDGFLDSSTQQPAPISQPEPSSSKIQTATPIRSLRDPQVTRSGKASETKSGQSEKNSDQSTLSRKRKAETLEPETQKRPKQSKPHAMVQSALYAAERLSNAILDHPRPQSRNCRFVSLAYSRPLEAHSQGHVDDTAHVCWWYDRQGAIQSTGINFIKDLPHFLVLLLAFEWFSPQNWGIAQELETSKFSFHFSAGVDVEIDASDKLFGHYGLVGRAIKVLGSASQSRRPQPQNDMRDTEYIGADADLESLAHLKVVARPEESRTLEADLIQQAMEVGKNDRDILPDFISSEDFPYSATGCIKRYLPLNDIGSRIIIRMLLCRRVYPITDLVGEEFWVAFWEIVRCHYKLWERKLRHRDISVRNLMYDKVFDAQSQRCRGKLNDFDLASHGNSLGPTGTDRTGTMPFMALDLLTVNAAAGGGSLLSEYYRHDLESFAWVLLWICARFDKGQEIKNPPFSGWLANDYSRCRKEKFDLEERLAALPTETYKQYWIQAFRLVQFFFQRHVDMMIRPVVQIDERSEQSTNVTNYGNDSMVQLLDECLQRAGIQLPISPSVEESAVTDGVVTPVAYNKGHRDGNGFNSLLCNKNYFRL